MQQVRKRLFVALCVYLLFNPTYAGMFDHIDGVKTDIYGQPLQDPKEVEPVFRCFLDKLPGTNNDPAAYSIVSKCLEHKGKHYWVFLNIPSDPRDCVIKYAKDTASVYAAERIRAACYNLTR